MKLRITYLAPGNSVHSYRWIKFFAEQGHEVHWISLDPFTCPPIPSVLTYDLSTARLGGLQAIAAVVRIRRIIKGSRPDILHAHSAALYGFTAALTGAHPFVLTAWGSDILVNGKSIVKRPIVRYILRRADLITTDADHMIDAMEGLGVGRERMELVRFGVETERFKRQSGDPARLAKFGFDGSPTIISLRNFYPVYDIPTLIDAVPRVLRRFPNARVLLVGSGPDEIDLKDLVRRKGLDPNVRFLGRVDSDDLPAIISASSVYVSTALSDAGIAASTAEAMACEVAPVITDSGENRLWVREGIDGFVVPSGNADALADRVIELLSNQRQRESLGESARRVILERNDYRAEMTRMEGLYLALLSSRSSAERSA